MHLPVKVFKDDSGQWRHERTKHVSTEALYAFRERFGSKLLFLGSCYAPDATFEEKEEIEAMLLEVDCIPVFQDSLPQFDNYLEFCQMFLWPVMNNQLPLQEDTEILQWDDHLWKAYKAANEMFCSRAMVLLSDMFETRAAESYINLWVNDFHLFLLPALLRKRLSGVGRRTSSTGNLPALVSGTNSAFSTPSVTATTPPTLVPNVTIALFVHTPYPTSEIFLTLPVRSELMRGLLSADLLGFQFYDYTRHFFSGAQRLFGVRATCQKGGLLALELADDRSVFIHITHNCIEQDYVVEEASSRQVQRKAAALREEFGNRVIIGSVDKLGRTSGILLKLRAFNLFLQQYQQYRNAVVLVLYIISRGPQKTTPEHLAIAEQAQALAAQINAELGFHVSVKLSVDEFDKSALLCVTDVLLETSLKDGLNLVPFEYIAARDTWLKLEGTITDLSSIHTVPPPLSALPAFEDEEDMFAANLVADCRRTGRVVISEFTGSSQVLPGALRVNPWHMDTILTALDESLTMQLGAAHAAFSRDAGYVASQSQVGWAREFATQIVRASLAASSALPATAEFSGELSAISPRSAMIVPANYSAIPRLNKEAVVAAFRSAKHRVLFLDNEGTLAPNLSRLYRHYGSISMANPNQTDLQAKGSGPNEEVLKILASLCGDPKNFVTILSGRAQAPLFQWFASVVPHGLGLAAEHGYCWTHPRITGLGDWKCLLDSIGACNNRAWIPVTEDIMNRYVNRTPNTYIEDKGSARVWQFRDAEAEFGPSQAKELHAELEIALRTEAVDITTGKGYVEVKVRGVNKGAAVERVLEALREEVGVDPDFILCIGDDRSDESMFERLLRPLPGQPAVFTCTVGRKKSMAKYFLSDVDHVTQLLGVLSETQDVAETEESVSS